MEGHAIREANRRFWNENADAWFGATALPDYGVLFETEESLGLFGDVTGARMLEIGCGSGHSLRYHAERGAAELWGIDLSEAQLKNAERYLAQAGHAARLLCAPMEEPCGIPEGHFDVVYSIYAIGWTIDLDRTFALIHSYLRDGGRFLFSWEHPLHRAVGLKGEDLVFQRPYFDEAPHALAVTGGEIILRRRRISTYVNALARAGFIIERMVEQTDSGTLDAQGDLPEKVRKAQMLPLSFVFVARKP